MECQERKSERARKQKQIFSPDIDKDDTPKKKKLVAKKLSKTFLQRPFDILPNGQPFLCAMCKSPYVVNLKSKGVKKVVRSRHQPLPQIRVDKLTGKDMMLCNACVLTYDRPRNRVVKHVKVPTEEELETYQTQVNIIVASLKSHHDNTLVERLYCPVSKKKLCGCLQKYINKIGVDHEEVKELLTLTAEAEKLSKEKSYFLQEPKKSTKRMIGLGNGHKKSRRFEEFVLSKRAILKDNLQLCERATQRILMYSNNFLHKRIKTENRPCRIERTRGKAALGTLPELHTLVDLHCCTDHCVMMALTHRKLLQDWRERACQGQMEARRVLAEMLTPAGAFHTNCYNFISMVTGCSTATIGRVYNQMIDSSGVRDPPEHGMKKVWQEIYKQNKNTTSTQQKSSGPERMVSASVDNEGTARVTSPSQIHGQETVVNSENGSLVQDLDASQHHNQQQLQQLHSELQNPIQLQILMPTDISQNPTTIQQLLQQLSQTKVVSPGLKAPELVPMIAQPFIHLSGNQLVDSLNLGQFITETGSSQSRIIGEQQEQHQQPVIQQQQQQSQQVLQTQHQQQHPKPFLQTQQQQAQQEQDMFVVQTSDMHRFVTLNTPAGDLLIEIVQESDGPTSQQTSLILPTSAFNPPMTWPSAQKGADHMTVSGGIPPSSTVSCITTPGQVNIQGKGQGLLFGHGDKLPVVPVMCSEPLQFEVLQTSQLSTDVHGIHQTCVALEVQNPQSSASTLIRQDLMSVLAQTPIASTQANTQISSTTSIDGDVIPQQSVTFCTFPNSSNPVSVSMVKLQPDRDTVALGQEESKSAVVLPGSNTAKDNVDISMIDKQSTELTSENLRLALRDTVPRSDRVRVTEAEEQHLLQRSSQAESIVHTSPTQPSNSSFIPVSFSGISHASAGVGTSLHEVQANMCSFSSMSSLSSSGSVLSSSSSRVLASTSSDVTISSGGMIRDKKSVTSNWIVNTKTKDFVDRVRHKSDHVSRIKEIKESKQKARHKSCSFELYGRTSAALTEAKDREGELRLDQMKVKSGKCFEVFDGQAKRTDRRFVKTPTPLSSYMHKRGQRNGKSSLENKVTFTASGTDEGGQDAEGAGDKGGIDLEMFSFKMADSRLRHTSGSFTGDETDIQIRSRHPSESLFELISRSRKPSGSSQAGDRSRKSSGNSHFSEISGTSLFSSLSPNIFLDKEKGLLLLQSIEEGSILYDTGDSLARLAGPGGGVSMAIEDHSYSPLPVENSHLVENEGHTQGMGVMEHVQVQGNRQGSGLVPGDGKERALLSTRRTMSDSVPVLKSILAQPPKMYIH